MEIIKFFFPEIYLSFTSLLILLLLSFISLNPSSQFFLWLINLFISFCLLVSNYNINYFISSEYFIGDLAHYYLRLVIFFFGFLLYFSLKNILFKESLINEFSLLFVLVLAFSSILLSSSNLLVAFVLIETISLSLYLLVSFYKKNLLSLEAGLKYFLFGTMASLFLFLGIFFIYYSTSEFSLSKLLAISYEKNTLFYLGFLLIFIGIVFKLGGVPFHFWAPEVYQGAPTMVFPLLILISKFSFAVFLINLVYYLIKINTAYPLNLSFFQNFFYLISLLSMILGNLLALKQKEIKRLLTYSSIAHIGYLLSLFTLPWNSSNLQIFLGYLFIYTLTLLGVNIILLIILQKNKNLVKIEIPSLELYLKDKNILLVLSFLIFIFSLAGLPPTAGFITKFIVLINIIKNSSYILALIFLSTSILSIYYYFQLIQPVLKLIAKRTYELKFLKLEFFELILTLIITSISFYLIFSTFLPNYIFFFK